LEPGPQASFEEVAVMRKILVFLLLLVGIAIGMGWPDAKRFLTIRRISNGHPEMVPAEGVKSYPEDPRKAEAEGTGDFDSARRGGPKQAPQSKPRHVERMTT
jgi:hypothetical protein